MADMGCSKWKTGGSIEGFWALGYGASMWLASAYLKYSELNLNQYSVGSPCRTMCTVCGSPPCPGLNLIHYNDLFG